MTRTWQRLPRAEQLADAFLLAHGKVSRRHSGVPHLAHFQELSVMLFSFIQAVDGYGFVGARQRSGGGPEQAEGAAPEG